MVDYKNTRIRLTRTRLLWIGFTILVICFLALPKPVFREVGIAVIHNEGEISYSDSTPLPPPSGGIDVIGLLSEMSRILNAVLGISVIVGAIAGLLKWLSWRAKHGKSRTPIIMPAC